ncbi:beta-N-acetylhexosaminidase family protein [Streptomyces sp. H27-D2]|uniref:beta-N-acetylhexosaminidase family protein n=1 Tax=Streptomyces sp. H27-D2 TaxID=3046304 RepID=UPI002DB8CD12|nr:beta-N-acetylglucosaminidase domain-containing protein [Streptomyces sp. H27-D2]MEC4017898.1 beta-N-acetylglucosaminidase domain-containing protein [Streptomyces sp. H27-D2]
MGRHTSTLSTCFAIAITMTVGGLAPAATASTAAPPDGKNSKAGKGGKSGKGQSAGDAAALPSVSPTPQSLRLAGDDAAVSKSVLVVADAATDPAARELLVQELRSHGAQSVEVVSPDSLPLSTAGRLTVRLGPATRPDIAEDLIGTDVPDRAEGYALRVRGGGLQERVSLGGKDTAGLFYAVQTLRRLFVRDGERASPGKRGDRTDRGGDAEGWRIAGVSVSDYPSMPLRGTIEGFYGQPWTPAERLDQMDFYGEVKANTYIYAPKDDPYHRGKWRDPYPADKLAELGKLVDRATANHVRFTFAVSPGTSICYSDPADRKALKAKLQALYDLGTRAFSIPLDDISYTKWNCAGDQSAYGAPGRAAAATAQAALLNDVQRDFIATHDGAQPLHMVPTEYGDLTDTAYKQTLRATLDPRIEIMWTGTDVVPPVITNEQADAAAKLFGRKVFVWDNYPVNDFDNTSGRLLLAPYDKRAAGLSERLTGIVANPMNQPYASKVAVFGAADFSWNDRAYDATKNWPRAMAHLAGDDRKATDALLVFGDLEHLAPTFGATPWQPQAPELARRTAEFWTAWDAGDRSRAVAGLRPYAESVSGAPSAIRAGSVEAGFTTDAKPWLDATELWGKALVKVLDALTARLGGDEVKARALLAESDAAQRQARDVRVDPPRNSWGKVAPKVGDGVLDTFITRAGAQLRDSAPTTG